MKQNYLRRQLLTSGIDERDVFENLSHHYMEWVAGRTVLSNVGASSSGLVVQSKINSFTSVKRAGSSTPSSSPDNA